MAKSIMIQGTMSSAGKSLICAALCRILKQDGLRVAPFKSQNMALNSFITNEGMEMGRAQVMQAEAAGVEPDVRMNPILLKPTSNMGSQVIVNGEILGNMQAVEYFAYKKKLIPEILKAYQGLATQYDVIVIEGAGSPAEINLKSQDIVNMGMAALVDAPVLLAGDIDRGGVFAQLYGTVALLEPEERARIQGLIINKFRGDKRILEPGLKMLRELTNIPVSGVIPYLNVTLDDEDSLAPRLMDTVARQLVDIAVIRLPHISNFTDFGALELQPEVGVRYVDRQEHLGTPDLLILPGTKNTMGDLKWLRQCGLEASILKLAKQDIPIIGICGGYQMLGEELRDPEGVEGERVLSGSNMRGLGLLPIDTEFTVNKIRTRVQGTVLAQKGFFDCLSGCRFSGYEIHMGKTRGSEQRVPFASLSHTGEKQLSGGIPERTKEDLPQNQSIHNVQTDGAVIDTIMGTYVHGLFDDGELTQALCNELLKKKGYSPKMLPQIDYAAFKEQQYDILASAVREALDMEQIYQLIV